MTAKKKKKKEEHHEMFESPEALQERLTRFEQFLEQNKIVVFSVVGIVVLAIAGIFLYRYYLNNQNKIAQSEMFQAVYYFEADSLRLALNGDGNNLGFLDIIDEYGQTKAANLAHYYTGAAYLKQGNYGQAIEHLTEFESDDLLIQARSYALIGDAYMELQDYQQAADYYMKAANYKPNKFFTPQYLMKAALAYELMSELETAKEMYDRIIEEFNDSSQTPEAKKQSARLEGIITS